MSFCVAVNGGITVTGVNYFNIILYKSNRSIVYIYIYMHLFSCLDSNSTALASLFEVLVFKAHSNSSSSNLIRIQIHLRCIENSIQQFFPHYFFTTVFR